MDKNTKIAIAGGGIGGLTTALFLLKRGFKDIVVYEQAPELKEVGAAVSLWPNALRVFEYLDFLPQIKPYWGAFKTVYIKSSSGKILQSVTPQFDLPTVCIHRADLHKQLVGQLSDIEIHTNYKLKSYTNNNPGVSLYFENGKSTTADVLIGADGINSAVRAQMVGDGKPIYRGYNAWRGVATLTDVPDGYGSETWGKGARIGIVPVKDGKFGWWATYNEERMASDEPEGAKEKLKNIFADWHDPIPRLFDNSTPIFKTSLGDRDPITQWFKEGAVLMGDAAHPTTPNLGQGACMAIEGAFLLAKAIDNKESSNLAFKAYQKAHYKRTRKVTLESRQLGMVGQWDNPLLVKIRDFAAGMAPQSVASKTFYKYFTYDVREVKL